MGTTETEKWKEKWKMEDQMEEKFRANNVNWYYNHQGHIFYTFLYCMELNVRGEHIKRNRKVSPHKNLIKINGDAETENNANWFFTISRIIRT